MTWHRYYTNSFVFSHLNMSALTTSQKINAVSRCCARLSRSTRISQSFAVKFCEKLTIDVLKST